MNTFTSIASHEDVLRLRVANRTLAADNIVAFELEAMDGMPLPEFAAGAHIEIDCNGLPRHYSLCSDPSDPMRYMIAVQCEAEGKGGSRHLYHEVRIGDALTVSHPRNHFRLQDSGSATHGTSGKGGEGEAGGTGGKDSISGVGSMSHAPSDILLIGGGIGITPLLAMAWTLHRSGQRFALHDFAASPERQAFREQIAQMPWAANVTRHLGRCEDFISIIGSFESGRHVYVCGPFAMIDAVLDAARAMGWPEANLHCERFSAPASVASAATQHDDGDAMVEGVNIPFDVELSRSGKRIPIAPDQSVCAALSAAGIHIPMSCEQGVCGSCLTRVLAGTPDHRDWILSAEEQAVNDQFTPCCSRSKTPLLVLDL